MIDRRKQLFILWALISVLSLVTNGAEALPIQALDRVPGASANRIKPNVLRTGWNAVNRLARPESGDGQSLSPALAGDLDTSFDPGLGITQGGTVYGVAVQGDGKIVIGGAFTSYNGVSRHGIARVNSDGSLDTTFNPGTGVNSTAVSGVYALAVQSDGKIVVGGAFINYNGVSCNGIVRVNSDGSFDSSFNSGSGLGSINGRIRAIALQGDGKIVLGGAFSVYNGVVRRDIVRINGDGSLDTSFSPSAGVTGGAVYAVAVQTDGKVVLAGSVTSYNNAQANYVVRANTDGSRDNSFVAGIQSTTGGAVYALAIQPDGKIVVGGLFRNSGSSFMFARLNGDGFVDSSFVGAGALSSGRVYAVAVQTDGKIILSGLFTNYNGTARNGLARANSDGTLDSSFNPGAGVSGNSGNSPTEPYNALATQSDGRVLFGGNFSSYDNVTRVAIARINGNGSLDASFDPGTGIGAVGWINAFAIQNDGKILIGGLFRSYRNVSRSCVARINADGSLDASFNPGTGLPENGNILNLAIQSDGKILLAGVFSSYNGVSRVGIVRINSDGTLDPAFNAGADSTVTAFALQGDGKILIGGYFTSIGGSSRPSLARLNSDGSLDASFDAGSGLNNAVRAIAIQSDGKILVGGEMNIYNGVIRNSLFRVNSNGSLDSSFNPPTVADNYIYALAIQNDGKIVVGGFQTILFANGVGRNSIGRINSDGTLDSSFDPGTGALDSDIAVSAAIFALAIQSDGRIVLGGYITKYDGVARNGIARINGDGSLDTSFNPGIGTNAVFDVGLQSDGRILLAGQFASYNGVERNGIARLLIDTPASFVQFGAPSYSVNETGGNVSVMVTRSGDTSGSAAVNYSTSDTSGANNCNVVNGAASSRCDYLAAIGTLHFAAGEISKTISVTIVDDSYSEGLESFTLTLSRPSGPTLGSQATTTISISDNDAGNGPNPIDQSAFFVRQHYIDFLNREPDASGLAFWTNNINGCTPQPSCAEIQRINTSAAFFLSIEFQETGYLVERLYKTAYGNASGASTFGGAHQLPVPIVRFSEFLPDTQEIGQGVVVGQAGWEAALENNKQAFTAEFVQRSRFAAAFPSSLTPAQFVAVLNQNAGSVLSPSEQTTAAGLFGGATKTSNLTARAQALRLVAEDADLKSGEFNRAFVLMQFFGYLRRNPNDPQDIDYTGYDFWLTKLNQFNGDFANAEMVKAFITSSEYRQRFGP